MKQLRLAVVGAGNRGTRLAALAVESGRAVQIGAVADPDAATVHAAGERFGVAKNRRFGDYRELLENCRDIDAAFIATDVRSHARIALDFMKRGLPLFLEKPITRTIDEAIEVYRAARAAKAPVFVGFNLRCAPFYRRLKDLVAGGAVGELISMEWKETLSPAAWADGYCRASWYSRTEDVGGWLFEKSCHDIDQLNWLAAAPAVRAASFGSRRYFVPRRDVPGRCTEGCPIERECLFSCFKLHPDGIASLPHYVPADRWDLCVYHSGSDLVDRQVAILEYETGVTAAFSIIPIGSAWERVMKICGSKATIRGSDSKGELRIHPHDGSQPTVADPPAAEGGHGGADPKVMDAFLRFLDAPSFDHQNSIEVGLESILAAGGIELARREQRVVELEPLRRSAHEC